jgi:hypothetical protein
MNGRFLYILYFAIDACFRLKCRLVSSEKKDPGLVTGWAYFTEDTLFCSYILTVTDQKEVCEIFDDWMDGTDIMM